MLPVREAKPELGEPRFDDRRVVELQHHGPRHRWRDDPDEVTRAELGREDRVHGRTGYAQLQAVLLEQPQPDLAHRRVRRDRVPQAINSDLADRLAIVAACTISAVSCPTNVAPSTTRRVRSIDEPCGADVAVGHLAGAGRGRHLHVDDVDLDAGLSRLGPRCGPTAATSGSVKITCGAPTPVGERDEGRGRRRRRHARERRSRRRRPAPGTCPCASAGCVR